VAEYKLMVSGVLRTSDHAQIPDNNANRDWRKYQDWLRDGGVPDPADPPPEVIDYQAELELQIRAAGPNIPELIEALLGEGAGHKAKVSGAAKI
jgi:hypothetical protein